MNDAPPPRLSWNWPLRLVLVTVLAVVIAVPAVLWWNWSRPRTSALEPRWAATTLVLAGDGTPGARDGETTRAQFSDPFGVAVAGDGTVYVADAGDAPRIRGISPDGRVFTLAGGERGFVDGAGQSARFGGTSGLAVDATGTLFVADTGNNVIRRVTRDGQVSTVAGDGVPGYRDGPAHQARFNGPIGVAVNGAGRIFVADSYNDRIRAIDGDGMVTTIAGSSEPGAVDGRGGDARFDTPCGVAVGGDGTLYIADTGNNLVRTIDPTGNVITPPWSILEGLLRPIGIAVSGGNVYVTDDRGSIVEIGADGRTRIVAGSRPGFRDGVEASFRSPTGIAIVAPGRLVVADAGNALVRLVAARSQLELRLPTPPIRAPGFDPERFALQPLLWPVAPADGPYEIAGTLGEVRGGDGLERFHTGIDVRVDEGTFVRAARNGLVVSPLATNEFGSLNEWLRIGDLSYVHIRAGRDRRNHLLDSNTFVPTYDDKGKMVRMRVKRGTRFETGDVIGTVNRFNHVHLTVGVPGDEYNPLRFRLVQFEDSVPPTIARGGVRLFDDAGQPLSRRERGRIVVSGPVQIVVDAWDQADGNTPQRRLGLYDLGYQVLTRDGLPVPGFETVRHTQRFDRLLDVEAARLVYARGSGIPFYGQRRTRFLYVVTNTFRDGVAAHDVWDTSQLTPGDYVVRVWASDIRGNTAIANRDLPVTVNGVGGHGVGSHGVGGHLAETLQR